MRAGTGCFRFTLEVTRARLDSPGDALDQKSYTRSPVPSHVHFVAMQRGPHCVHLLTGMHFRQFFNVFVLSVLNEMRTRLPADARSAAAREF